MRIFVWSQRWEDSITCRYLLFKRSILNLRPLEVLWWFSSIQVFEVSSLLNICSLNFFQMPSKRFKNQCLMFKKKSTRSSRNKWKNFAPRLFTSHFQLLRTSFKYLKNISDNRKCHIQIFNLASNTWEYWRNEADNNILPVLAWFLNFKLYFFEFP